MFPPEGASPQIRLEITDLDVCLSMHNLGTDYMVILIFLLILFLLHLLFYNYYFIIIFQLLINL